MTTQSSDTRRRFLERSATLLVGALAATLGYAIHEARAEGVPTTPTMFYSGTLEEGGVAAEGTRQMKLRIFDAVSSGNQLCESVPNETGASGNPGEVTVRSGRFRFAVSDACVDAVRAHPDVFAELVVGSDPLPRAKVGAVPYAIEAEHAMRASVAETATGALKGSIDERAPVVTSVVRTTTQPLSSGVRNQVQFTTTEFQVGDGSPTLAASGAISIIRAGTYRIAVAASVSANVGGSGQIMSISALVLVNGAGVDDRPMTMVAAVETTVYANVVRALNVGDVVTVALWQGTGSTFSPPMNVRAQLERL